MKFLLLAVITWTVIHHVISKAQLSRVAHLSTFRTENLKIRAPTKRFASIVDEAIWLMRTHFIKRHLLSRNDWETLSAQFADCPDVNKAMEELMRRFNDPYSRHIPESSMTVRQRGIRGEMIGIGVVLKRTWKYSELRRAVVGLFLSSRDTDAAVGKTVLTSGSSSSNRFESAGNVLSSFIGRFNRNVLGTAGHNPMQSFPSLIQHFCVTLHTVTPFLLSATCHRLVRPRVLVKFPRSIRGIQIFGICVGALQVFFKMTPFLCPIEVDSLQSGGPSIFSGVEVGDQIHLIDGRTVNSLSLSKVNELLNSGNVGDIVSLGIIRDSLTTTTCRLSNEVGTSDTHDQNESGYTIRQDATSTPDARLKNNLKKDSSSKNRKSRVHLTLGVMKDNVFAGKVSSSILSYTESRQKTKYNGNLVASAGSLVGGDVTVGRGGIGYISIKEFTQRTVLELENAIDKIRTLLAVADVAKDSQSRNSKYRNGSRVNTELSALVIDLRGNLGGTLPSALDAAALFLPYGKPLLQMKRTATVTSTPVTKFHDLNTPQNSTGFFTPRRRISGTISRMLRNMNVIGSLTRTIRLSRMNRREIYYSTCNHADITTPLLLLVDSQTASASEIFASALIDNSRAVSVGSRTVGKNVAQAIMMLTDGSGLVFTVREFLGPFGRFMGDGIAPDMVLSKPGTLDLSKIHFDTSSKKWNVLETSFPDHCPSSFE